MEFLMKEVFNNFYMNINKKLKINIVLNLYFYKFLINLKYDI